MPPSCQYLSQAILDACRDTGRVYPDDTPPLLAHCSRHQKCQRYLFTQKLPLWRTQRHTFTYLFHLPQLDFNSMAQCLDLALEQGLDQVKPGCEHRRWDICVILLCDLTHPDALERLERFHRARAYKLGLQGRALARVVAVDLSTGEVTHSRRGMPLARFVQGLMAQPEPSL